MIICFAHIGGITNGYYIKQSFATAMTEASNSNGKVTIGDSTKLLLSNVYAASSIFAGIYVFTDLGAIEELGAFFLFQAATSIFGIVTDGGVSGAVEKRISGDGRAGTISSGFVLFPPLYALSCAFVFIFYLLNSGYFPKSIWMLLAVNIGVERLGRFFIAVMRGQQKVGDTAVF